MDYLQRGSGKDLVFLHGYLSSKESFYPQINYFSKYFRVTALDFPGFGEGEPLKEAYSVGDYADWLQNKLQTLNVENACVLAHSFGGRVAVKCLSRGRLFQKAVLCGCAGIKPKRTPAYHMKVGAYKLIKKFAPRYAEKHFGSAEYRSLPPLMKESYKKIVNEDLRSDACKIECPVLFITGENDGETPVSSAKIYNACVKGSKLLIMKNCGHFAHLDDPLAFNLAAEEFLL